MLTIQNVRLGHATNSSSSHSIVFESWRTTVEHGGACTFEYGWEDFRLTTVEDKLCYLAVAVWDTLRTMTKLPTDLLEPVWRELFKGTAIEPFVEQNIAQARNNKYGANRYIDHQSAFTLPVTDGSQLRQRVQEYAAILTDSRVVIYGGNDNDGSGYRGSGEHLFTGDEYRAGPRIRKDGDHIVVYNGFSGAKMRFGEGPYTKATVPELVDLKITDKCPYNCAFCYQGSTPEGKDGKNISTILTALARMGVFEIAIGGGEPTHARDFASVIHDAKEKGLTPNFTTFGTDWLAKPEIVEAAKLCGGIGVSVENADHIRKALKIRDVVLPGPVVQVQHVVGSQPLSVLDGLLSEARAQKLPILLLGFKTTGRGATFKPQPMDGIGEVLAKHFKEGKTKHDLRLSVDTAFVDAHMPLLGALDVPEILVTSPEGKFSMYIDAVKQVVGPSSYCDPRAYEVLPEYGWGREDDLAQYILETFAKW